MAEGSGTPTELGEQAVNQIGEMFKDFQRRLRNEMPSRGRWQFHGGSGGGHQIWFTIDDVYCTDAYDDWHLVVTANWYTGGCLKTPPGANDDGTYNIYDICSIHTFYVATELVGTVGRATYFYPLTGDCEPKWLLDTLCLQPECA